MNIEPPVKKWGIIQKSIQSESDEENGEKNSFGLAWRRQSIVLEGSNVVTRLQWIADGPDILANRLPASLAGFISRLHICGGVRLLLCQRCQLGTIVSLGRSGCRVKQEQQADRQGHA